MRTVTDAFTTAWRNKSNKFAVREIWYKRRYWNGSAFVYEASWNVLSSKYFQKIGSTTQQLDSNKLNEFKTSNLTIYLNNVEKRWFPQNNGGYFAPDAVATSGYTAYKTLFQVWSGYELADGTEETISRFTGVLVDYAASINSDVIEFVLTGLEEKLQNKSAHSVSIAFTNEATIPPTGVAGNKVFTTTSTGVGFILTAGVKADGVPLVEGTDYKISQLNEYGLGAVITMEAAHDGEAITVSGNKWYTLKRAEELVGMICDAAGIAEADRTIETTISPQDLQDFTLDTTTEWLEGTLFQNITTNITNKIAKMWILCDDFASLTLAKWTTYLQFGGSATANSGYMHLAAPLNGTAYASLIGMDKGYGTYQWRMKFTGTPLSPVYTDTGLAFISTNSFQAGYGIFFLSESSIVFRKNIDSGNAVDYAIPVSLTTDWHTYRVTRSDSGEFNIYVDTVLRLTVTDNDYTSGGALAGVYAGADCTFDLDDFWVSDGVEPSSVVSSDSAVYRSKEFDITTLPVAWGAIVKSQTLNSGTVKVYVATHASSGSAYADGEFVEADPQIIADLEQYFMLKVEFTVGSGVYKSPALSSLTAEFTTVEVFVTLANFTALSCYTAMQKLGRLTNSEWGFDGTGHFFYRPKRTDKVPVITLTQKDVVNIASITPGWNRVLNNFQVKYGEAYYREYNSTTAGEASPTSQEVYGDKLNSETVNDFLVANDKELALTMAQLTYESEHLPKMRLTVDFALIPHLELSDFIILDFSEDPLLKDIIAGDPLQKFGFGSFGEAGNEMILREKTFKVISLTQRDNEEKTGTILEEVL